MRKFGCKRFCNAIDKGQNRCGGRAFLFVKLSAGIAHAIIDGAIVLREGDDRGFGMCEQSFSDGVFGDLKHIGVRKAKLGPSLFKHDPLAVHSGEIFGVRFAVKLDGNHAVKGMNVPCVAHTTAHVLWDDMVRAVEAALHSKSGAFYRVGIVVLAVFKGGALFDMIIAFYLQCSHCGNELEA